MVGTLGGAPSPPSRLRQRPGPGQLEAVGSGEGREGREGRRGGEGGAEAGTGAVPLTWPLWSLGACDTGNVAVPLGQSRGRILCQKRDTTSFMSLCVT